MMAFLAQVLLQIFVLERVLWSALCSGNCSCYTFHGVKKFWKESNLDCKSRNGILVSIETLDEWKFINTEIQKRNISGNEWHIGLKIQGQKLAEKSTREGKRKAEWKWTSGQKYTFYNKWQPNEPNSIAADLINTYFCGVMAKEWPLTKYGLFKDLNCVIRKFTYICEYGEGIAVKPTLMPVCWNKYTKTRSSTSVQAITTTAATTLPVTTNVVTNSLIPTINNVPVTVTKTTIKIASTPVYETPTSRQNTPNLSAANTQDTFDTVLIIVIVLAIALVVLICGFIVVYCKKRKKSGKSSSTEKRISSRDNQSTNIITQETNLSIPTTSNGIQTAGGDLVIYAEVISSVATDPNPTYNEVQGYLSPVDAHVPSQPTDYYSNVDETLSKQRNNALNPLNTKTDGENEDIGTYESITVGVSAAKAPPAVYAVVDKSKKTREKRAGVGIATKGDVNKNDANNLSSATPAVYAVVDKSKKTKEKKAGVGIATKGDVNKNDAINSSSAMPAVYAVVDKSKKTKEKKAAVGIATEKNKAKDDASTYESEISSVATPAIYAVVNKSTKEKKAGVGIATMDENKKERVDDQDSTYENTRKDNETYEQISRDLYSGLSYDKRQPEENCDHSGPEVPLYSSVDSG